MKASPQWVVYRCYDANDWLLYVGCTCDLPRRMQQHSSQSLWFPHVARTEASQPYRDSRRAFDAEAATILAEAPAFNKVHNLTRVLSQMCEDEFFLEDARPLVGISVQMLRREIGEGRLAARYVEGRWVTTRAALTDWIAAAPTERKSA